MFTVSIIDTVSDVVVEVLAFDSLASAEEAVRLFCEPGYIAILSS